MSETDDLPRPELQAVGVELAGRWSVARDLQDLGEVKDSALTTPHYLLRRRDGQVVQVSALLYAVLSELDPDRTPAATAEAVSASYGRRLTLDGLRHLIESRLVPLGLVEDADGLPPAQLPTARPVLSLSMRGTLVPARVANRVGGWLRPLFLPPAVLLALVSWIALDVALVRQGDLLTALQQLLAEPATLLLLYAVLTTGSLVHELGHATACRYGGARPGAIGFGVYLVFPAFYTDVTDSYRLSRAGRVRTDLGGLYFNVLWVLALGAAYLATGSGVLLLAALVTQLEMVQQLVPAVRFDGYYVLSDLIGVPDLFARVRPTLLSLVPGRPADPRVTELKPRARRLVVGWVLVVVPLLGFGLGWLLWNLPVMVEQSQIAGQAQVDQLTSAWADNDVVVVVLSCISLVFLVLPLLGVLVLLWRLLDALGRGVLWLMGRSTGSRDLVGADSRGRLLTAAAFNDEYMLPAAPDVAKMGWQRTVYQLSGHSLRLGPGAEERRRAERADRLRAPILGTRRVVVMSRKGGVGKTTVTLALGSILATERGDRVVAVDANPDAGNLAHRVAPVNGRTITDVLRDMDDIGSYADLKRYTSQAPESRLEVLASDDDTRIGIALNRADYHRLIGLLDRFYNLILLDTGTGILDSANQGLLSEADQLVLVLRSGIDGGRAAALTLDWLQAHGYGRLVSEAVVVINAVRPKVGAPIAPIQEHFEHRCRRVVTVPWDPALETGAQTMVSNLDTSTGESLLEVAAAVAENFSSRSAAR